MAGRRFPTMTMFLTGGGTIINCRNDYKRYQSRPPPEPSPASQVPINPRPDSFQAVRNVQVIVLISRKYGLDFGGSQGVIFWCSVTIGWQDLGSAKREACLVAFRRGNAVAVSSEGYKACISLRETARRRCPLWKMPEGPEMYCVVGS